MTLVKADAALSLIQPCCAIKQGASPIGYHDSLSFQSQDELFAWMDDSSRLERSLVTTLRLTLTNIESTLLGDGTFVLGPSRRAPELARLCANVLRRLQFALQALPRLTHMTLASPGLLSPAFREWIYLPLLASLPAICPHLKHLKVDGGNDILQRISRLERQGFSIAFTKPLHLMIDKDECTSQIAAREPATVGFDELIGLLKSEFRAKSAPARYGRPSS